MRDFEHPRLGKLQYDHEFGWIGWIALPRFAECHTRDFQRHFGKLLRRIEAGELHAEDANLDSDFNSEEIDEQIHRIEGKLRVRVLEVGREGLSPAQERSLDYLLDHEEEILNAVLGSQFRTYQEYVDEELDFQTEFGIDYEDVPRDIDSPEQLKQRMSISYVEIAGDAIDGFVRIELSGACDWDEEHGFEVEILKDRVLDFEEELSDGFPCPVPDSIDLAAFLPTDSQTRPVEFLIYGRWSGIYQIDRDGKVVNRQFCMLCPGRHWDPEGVENVRIPEPNHLKMATNPYAMILPLAATASGCLAPVFLVLGLLIWGGLFWGAVALSTLEFAGKLLHPLLRKEAKTGDYLRNAVVIAISIAGLVYWQKRGALGPNETFLTVIGWIAWVISAYAFLTAVKNSAISVMQTNSPDNPLPLTVAWPNILFSIVVGVALWKTYAGDVSKLHLIWAVPATFLICLLLGIRGMMNQLRSMGGKWQERFFPSSRRDTIFIDPDEKHRHDEEDEADEADD